MLFGKKKDLRPAHPNFDENNLQGNEIVVRGADYTNVVTNFVSTENHVCYAHEIYSRQREYVGRYVRDMNTGTCYIDNSYSNGDKGFNAPFFTREDSKFQLAEGLPAGVYYDTTDIKDMKSGKFTVQRTDGQVYTLGKQEDAMNQLQTSNLRFSGDVAKFMNGDGMSASADYDKCFE